MTLCIVWRTDDNIHFSSDSRGSLGSKYIDAVIKVLRIPYEIVGTAKSGKTPQTITRGELGMTASGATLVAMMTKEALVEIIRKTQGVEGHNSFGMDEISDLMFRGFKQICNLYSEVGGEKSKTEVIIAGYCFYTKKLRAFKMEHDGNIGGQIMNEVLTRTDDIEFLGSGISIAKDQLPKNYIKPYMVVEALTAVIADDTVNGVGGNVQYGTFRGKNFYVSGVAVRSKDGVHYWRGPLDLNGAEFESSQGLLPHISYLDFIQ